MAVDIFLKLGSVQGESLDAAHTNEIDVLSWSWGMNQSGTMHLGTGGGGGKVSVENLSITKYTDKATPAIMTACCTGTHYPTVTLTVRKAGKTPLEYYIIVLTNALVVEYSTGGSDSEDRFTESVTLNFERFQVSYQPQDATGAKLGGVVESKWNIPANATA
ncbi:type VI secretion system tube protein Hcp [Paraburkholderia sp. RL18-103-BIB-C]|jgi:type VI secretion system secreted protein Hcp|uniref:Hcp family type VI secretion system effector n=1 Tax=unclassified Paraburkholderia TaxID=2615204 RepID=UPI0038B87195